MGYGEISDRFRGYIYGKSVYCKVPDPGLIGILVNDWAALYTRWACMRGHFEVSWIRIWEQVQSVFYAIFEGLGVFAGGLYKI